MANKHLTNPPSDVALARLKTLLESVNDTYHSGEMVLESDIASSYHEALNLFYESLDGSIVGSVMKIYTGAPADPSIYNIFTTAIRKDIQAIFSEIAALDRIVTSTFNSIAAEHKQVNTISKSTSNKLGDYLLYADPSLGAGYFFGDSFSSLSRIEIGSDMVDTEECFVSQEEGIVLLPLDGSPNNVSVKSITINKPSNGIAGSNYQLDVFGHEDIEVISDNEPNTWFEYEKVTIYETNKPLVLDITIALEEISVINHININPINFGTPNPIKVVTIETSKDGSDYSSIKDEVPLKDFVSEDEKEEFDLSPATSKFSGQGFYTFLPRKVQYVHIVMEQHTPYTINTNNGTRLRYAIGIRDINIVGRKFQSEGSLVSTPFTSSKEIRKVSLWASENPTEESVLADLKHFVSHDDGASWLPIQPQLRSGSDIPEIVNFNNISDNSIETTEPVTTLRHKISMKRNKDAFKGNVTIKQEKIRKMDVVSVPGGGQFDVFLTEQPIKRSINILLPFMGSFSCPRSRNGNDVRGQSTMMDLDFVEFFVDIPGERVRESDKLREGSLRFKLPFKGISHLRRKIRVFVNGEQIEYCHKNPDRFPKSSTSYGNQINSDSKIYFLNKKGTELQFGYTHTDGTQYGYIPAGGSRVQVCLDGDNPFLRLTDRGYILNLSAPSDGSKPDVSIVAITNMDPNEVTRHEIEIPPGKDKHESHPDITDVQEEKLTVSERQSNRAAKKTDKNYEVSRMFLGNRNNDTSDSGETPEDGQQRKMPTGISTAKGGHKKTTKELFTTSFSGSAKKAHEYISEYAFSPITDDSLESELDHENQDISFADAHEGMFPPIYVADDDGVSHFEIIETDLDGNKITGTSMQFTTPVAFVDGEIELTWTSGDSESGYTEGEKVASRYTFDHNSGTVYLGSTPAADRKTTLICKKRNLKIIKPKFWKFDKNRVTGKVNTRKIILDPRVVFTMKRTEVFDYTANIRKIDLLADNTREHNWYNAMLVRGTVKPGKKLFNNDAQPLEVPFIDGESEFSNTVTIKDESVTLVNTSGYLYEYQLNMVNPTADKNLRGIPTFGVIRETTSATAPTNQFDLTPQAALGDLNSNGEWHVSSTGLVTIYLDSEPEESYIVSYKIKNIDPGIDINGLYSVDYDNGVIHFSEAIPLTGDNGKVKFEVSAYSAFYNIAEEVGLGDIDNIDEEQKKVTFDSAFGMRFLKQDTALKARPQVLKIFYQYYKKETESLEDLEPYFSPICKDVAFRSVTVDLLEEL